MHGLLTPMYGAWSSDGYVHGCMYIDDESDQSNIHVSDCFCVCEFVSNWHWIQPTASECND